MKVAIYSPYLDSFGGGERYVLSAAEILSENHHVNLLLDDHLSFLEPDKLLVSLSERFNLNLSKVKLVKAPIGAGSSFLNRLLFLHGYDLLFYLTDGSIFYSTAGKNIIHFQVPFKNNSAKNIWGKIKLSSWNLAVCNSKFTQRHIKEQWTVKAEVLYPPVNIEEIRPLKKKKQILSVGRFTSFSKSKKHEEMIGVFCKLYDEGKIKGWSLHLVGSVEGDESYIGELKKLALDKPVFFYPNLDFKELVKLYGESIIYWHAAGFGESDPTKMEHFGITTVEAMAGGCVPVVINLGGQTEIVEDGKSGFLWNNTEELEELTLKVIDNPQLFNELSKNSIKRSKDFSKEYFSNRLMDIINSLK